MTHNTRPTNGVSYGYLHTITAQDATDNNVLIDFQTPYDLVAVVIHTDASGAASAMTALTITYPAAGQVNVAGTFSEDEQLFVIAQRDSSGLTY